MQLLTQNKPFVCISCSLEDVSGITGSGNKSKAGTFGRALPARKKNGELGVGKLQKKLNITIALFFRSPRRSSKDERLSTHTFLVGIASITC